MKVSFINVGYGDSILIEYEWDEGRYNILIDGGKPDEDHYAEFPQRIKTIDYLVNKGIEKINLLIITHLHEDHVGGLLEVAQKIEIGEVWCNYAFPEDYTGKEIAAGHTFGEGAARLLNALNIYNRICCMLKGKGIKIREINGIRLNEKIVDRLHADVFGPEGETALIQKELMGKIYTGKNPAEIEEALAQLDAFINNTSIVLRFMYNDKSVLLGGDVYNTYWKGIINRQISIRSDILKLPHHGHMDSVSEEFVAAVKPEFVVISVSNNRPDNCPNPGAIELIRKCGVMFNKPIKFLFTDAVNLPPHSTFESRHIAVEFKLSGGQAIEYEFI